jgi:hypothetical protein
LIYALKKIFMIYKGLWFYGLSGSGKTFASKYLIKKIKKSFLIDGDDVRKTLSKDLDYSLDSRKIQISRLFSIAELCLINKFFPIVSSVYMNKNLINKCGKQKILLINVQRANFETIKLNHKTYKNKKNVVGVDIHIKNYKTRYIFNPGNKEFCKNLELLKKLVTKRDT